MSAAAVKVYARIVAACCPEHGLRDDAELETHIRAIVERVLEAKGLRA